MAAGISCGERATGPATRGQAALAFQPTFSERAALVNSSLTAFGLTIDNVRIRLERTDGSVVIDTIIPFALDQDSVALTLTIPITGSQETFSALVELRQGTTVLFSGTQSVIARAGANNPAAPDIVTEYVGPGASATMVEIAPGDTTILPATQVAFTATARDDGENVVPDVPVEWVLSDSTVGTVSGTGLFTATAIRGETWVIARIPSLVADSSRVSIVPPATEIVVVSGGNQTGPVGLALPEAIVVESRAADGLAVPGVPVTFALTAGTGALSEDSVVTDALGRASTTLTFDATPGARTVEVSSAGLASVNIGATAVPGAPTQLVLTQQPSATAGAGEALAQAPLVALRDGFNNQVPTSGVPITVALTSAGMGTLGGTLTVNTDPTGTAVFSDLTVNGPIGIASLTFTSGALAVAVSDNITITLGPAATLLIEGGTNFSVIAGDTLADANAARVVDAGGNGVPGVDVVVAQDGQPDTTLVTDGTGRVLMKRIGVPEVADTYLLTFSSAGLVGSPVVVTVNVLPSSAATLLVTQQPSTNAVVGVALVQQPQVQVLDSLGNAVTSAGIPVTAEVLGGTHAVGGTVTVNTNATGLAVFTDLSVAGAVAPVQLRFTSAGLADAISDTITLLAAPPTQLVFTTQPANGSAGAPFTVVVEVRDAGNNLVAGFNGAVNLSIGTNPANGTLSGDLTVEAVGGVSTFPGLSIDSVGNGYTLLAAAEGLPGETSDPFNMIAGAGTPTQLAFTTQPVDVDEDTPFSVAVTARDAFNDPAPGFTGAVTLSIANNPSAGVLGGVLTANAINGVATFTGLSVSESGAGYTLRAAAAGLTPDTSNAFEVFFSGITYFDERRAGDIAIYKNYNTWSPEVNENRDEVVLQATPFKLAPGLGDYAVRPMGQLSAGIPVQTSLLIIPSASQGNAFNQITEQNAGAANLDSWVRNGGWLVVHAGDNAGGQAYIVPGMLTAVDDTTTCDGTVLAAVDHAFIRGPDAILGTADDLVDGSIGIVGGYCDDNHGALNGKLPGNAEVLLREGGIGARPTYATYTLGAGRVIITTLSIEYLNQPMQTMINHLYWAINGVNAGPAQPIFRAVHWLGGDGNWGDSTKWDIGVRPAIDDTVKIVAAGTYTVTLDRSVTAEALILGGAAGTQTLRTDFWQIELNGSSVVAPSGVLHLENGSVGGTGTLTVNGLLQWSAGTMNGTGTTRISVGGLATMDGTNYTLDGGRQFQVAGTVQFLGGGLEFRNGSQLLIEAGGEFDAQNGGGLGFGSGGGSIVNAGRFARTTAGSALNTDVTFTNNGEVEIEIGSIAFSSNATVTHAGQFIIQPGTTLDLANGIHTFNGAVSGGGVLRHVNGTNTLAGPVTLSGLFLQSSGTMSVTGPLNLADSLRLTSGTLNLNTGNNVAVPLVAQIGGTIQGADTLVVLDSLHWENGFMRGAGHTRVVDTAVAVFTTTSKTLGDSRGLEIRGAGVWNGGQITSSSTSPIVIGPNAELVVEGDLNLFGSGAATLLVQGRIVKTAGSGVLILNIPTTVSGELEAASGVFRLGSSATITHSGRFVTTAPAILEFLQGVHTLDSTVVGTGNLRVGGATVTTNDGVNVGTLSVVAGTLNANGPVVVTDTMSLLGGTTNLNTATNVAVPILVQNVGTLQGSDTLIVTDSLHWTGGLMGGTGTTRVNPGATATLTGVTAKVVGGGRRFEVLGTAVWNDGSLTLGGGSPVIVGATGVFEIHNNVSLTTTAGGGTLENNGTITRPVGTAIVSLGVPVTNTGLIDVQTGTLRFTATGALPTLGGTVNVASGAIVDFGGGTLSIGSTFTGAGTAQFSAAIATMTGSYGLPTLRVNAATLTLGSGGQYLVPTVVLTGGTIAGADTLVVTDSLDWSNGVMSGLGQTRTLDTTFVALSSTNSKTLTGGRQFRLEGNAFLLGGTITLGGGSQFLVAPTGILAILGDFGITTTTGSGTFLNQGAVMKTTGVGVSQISAPFTNDGTVAAMNGIVRFTTAGGPYTHAGDFAVTDPGVIEFNAGTHIVNGSLAGTGTTLFSGSATTINGTFFTPRLQITSGTVTLSSGDQHTIPLVVMSGGTLAGPDTLIVTDSMHWSGGTMNGGGATRILDSVVVSMTSASGKTLTGARGFELAGTAILGGGDLSIGGGSAYTIEPTGTFAFEGTANAGVLATTGSGTFVNAGQITKYVGANISTISVPFTNSGTVDVTIGTLRLSAAGGPFTHTGDFTIQSPAAFEVQGTGSHIFAGSVTGSGTASFGGSGTSVYSDAFALPSVSVSSGTLDFTSPAGRVELARLAIVGGTVTGSDTLVVTDSMTWTTGNHTGTGITQILDTVQLALTGAGGRSLLGGRRIEVGGAMVVAAGSVTFGGGSTLVVESGAQLDLQSGVSFNTTTGSGSVTNQGIVSRTTAAGTSTFTVPFENQGVVDVQIGLLVLQPAATVNHTGDFTVSAPGAITFTTGTHTISGTLKGTGLAQVTAGASTFSDTVDIRTFNSTGGTTTFTGAFFSVDTLRGGGGAYAFDAGRRHEVPILLMTGVQLLGVDTIAVTDSLDWTTGTMGGTGRTEIPLGAAAVVGTTGAKTLNGGRSFDVAGTLFWSGGNWSLATSSPIRVAPTGEFTIATASSLSGVGTLLNEGTLRRANVAGNATVSVPFTNAANVEVTTGVLILSQPAGTTTHTGPFVVTAPGLLEFGGVGTTNVNGSVTGTGTGRVSGTTLSVNGGFGLPILISTAGAATFTGPVSALDTLRQTGGTLSLSGGATVPVTRLFLSSGTLSGSDTITVLDSMEWSGATMGGGGHTRIVDTAQLVMSGASRTLNGGRGLEIAGNALWSAGTITVGGGSPITVTPAGDFQILANVNMNTAAGLGSFTNAGLVRRTAGTGFSTFTVPFENSGTVQAFTGSLSIAPPDTSVHSGAWEVTLPSLLTFSAGTHTIDGNITGTGRVSFAGTAITVNGDIDVSLIQQATGTTTILGVVSPLDSLTVNGGTIISFNSGGQVETAVLMQVAGVIGGVDTLIVLDSLDWSGGTMGGSGRTELPDTAVFVFRGGAKTLADTRTLAVGGTGAWTAGGITLGAGTLLAITPTGELDIRLNASSGGLGTMLNSGRILKTTSTGTATLGSVVQNDGEFELQVGSVTFSAASGTMTHGGPFVVGSGTLLSFTGAAVHQLDSTITGAGTVTLGGSNVVFNDSVNVPKLRYAGGTLAVNAPLVVTDSLISTIAAAITLNVPMTIPSGAVMSLQNNGAISGTGSITNLGRFQKTSSSTLAIAVPFDNQGSVSSGAGVFNFTRSFAHTAAGSLIGGATIQLNPDSVTVFDGAIAPGTTGAGQLTLTGAIVQSTTSPINIEIGGTIVISQYDRLVLTNQAFINGVLNLSVINGFVPAPSANFTIMTFPAGTTVSFAATNLPPGWTLNTSSGTTVVAIAPP